MPADVDRATKPQEVDDAGLRRVTRLTLALAARVARLRRVDREEPDALPGEGDGVAVDHVDLTRVDRLALGWLHEHEERDPNGHSYECDQAEDGERGFDEAVVSRAHDGFLCSRAGYANA